MTKASENVFPKIIFSEETAPATPSAGEAVVYVKSDGKLYLKDDAGTETDLTAAGGGGGSGSDWSPILDTKGTTDDPPDDEFDDTTGMSGATNGLDAKWTATSGASGTVGLTATSGGVYDLATRAGWVLLQPDGTTPVRLRQDFTLGDGDSIVCAFATSIVTDASTGVAANEFRGGIGINNNDTDEESGTFAKLYMDTNVDGWRVLYWNGTTQRSTGSGAGTEKNYPIGHLHYLRILRSGTTYYGFWSEDGATWNPLGSFALGSAMDNLWIWADASSPTTPLPVYAARWIRQGSNSYDPW